MSLAGEFFDAMRVYRDREDEVISDLLAVFGIDLEAPQMLPWPCADFTFDDYDSSFEMKQAKDDFAITRAQADACLALGFERFWICYQDGTEVYGTAEAIYPRKARAADAAIQRAQGRV